MTDEILFDKETGVSVHDVDNTPVTKTLELTLPKWYWEVIELRTKEYHEQNLSDCVSDLLNIGLKSFIEKSTKFSDKPDTNKWN